MKKLRLEEARKQLGLTQEQVAEKLGISQNNYSYLENGKVKIDSDYLLAFAEIFGCSVDYLLGMSNVPQTDFTRKNLTIKNADDRRTVAAILADNGYSVKIDRVTVGKTVKGAVVFWKDEEKKEK